MRREEWSDELAEELMKKFSEMQDAVLGKLAQRIETLEDMSPAEIEAYAKSAAMSEAIEDDLKYVRREISKQNRVYSFQIAKIFNKATNDIFSEAAVYFNYRQLRIEKYMKKSTTVELVKKLQKETVSDLLNLSHTYCYDVGGEVSEIGKAYRKIVNRAVVDAASGKSIDQVIKETVNKLSGSGIKTLRWDKESGKAVVRRADSHVRMNIEEGLNRLNERLSEENGKAFGADGVQLSMHALCAPDHLHIQGRRFTLEEYEELNNELSRPVGTCNCKHWASPCIMGVSSPIYSDREIKDAALRSNAQVKYNGKSMTRYEASQKMRAYERSVRKSRSAEKAYRAANKTTLADQEQRKIAMKMGNYNEFCDQVGLTPQPERTKYVI